MKLEVVSKLKTELNKGLRTEAQIVYILSRIRKLIEFEKKKLIYPYLYFYCDLSLHSEIDKTKKEPRHGILKTFVENPENTHRFGFHTDFRNELNLFLVEYGIRRLTGSRLDRFIFLLGQVIADTPIIINIDNFKYTIVFKPPENIEESGLRIISHDKS
jgi:hypothetical protein